MSAVVKFPGEFDGPPPPPPPDEPEHLDEGCPVGFLGQRDDGFHFFDHLGQLRMLTAQKIAQAPQISALFGPVGHHWLADMHPAIDKEGEEIEGKFHVGKVNLWILEQSRRAGLFDPTMPVRGIGVWRAGELAVLHLGHTIRWGGQWRAPGFAAAGALWPAYHAGAEPADPAPRSAARALESMFARWNWREPMGAALIFGLWAAGMMGAAIPWRPHAFLVGDAGSGKSTLFELMATVSPLALLVDDYTEAGLRQTLSSHAGAALLDEADPDDALAAEKLQRVIGLLRRASGGPGATVLRGGAGGTSQQFNVVASAIMGGTLPPSLLPADASRITVLGLRPLTRESRAPSPPEMAEMRRLGPALLARAVDALPRFPAAFAAAREQILALDGGSHRMADQLGSILAARHIMQHDDDFPVMSDELAELAWAIPTEEDREVDGGPRQCLNHLLHSGLESYRSGERPTVRSTLLQAFGAPAELPERAERELFDHGMRVGPYPLSGTGPPGLYVMNKHPRLSTIYAGQRWAGGKWSEDLSRLPGAVRPPNPVSLATGEKHRCIWLPRDLLPQQRDAKGQ
nr:hypothetical protein [uncultured Roseococcus sp.]